MEFRTVFVMFVGVCFSFCTSKNAKLLTNKKFKQNNSTAVFKTKFIIDDKKDITKITHEKEDGAWQFFSNDNFVKYEDVVKIVSLGQITKNRQHCT